MKLKIKYLHPPIPIRQLDYMAYDDEAFDATDANPQIIGWGSTLEAARADFMSKWLDSREQPT